MTPEQQDQLIKALMDRGYSEIDAFNATRGTRADELYKEYCDKRIILHDLFIGDFRMSQKFGINKKMYAKYGLEGHDGIDFACPTGTKLLAPINGIVIKVKYNKGGYGTHIEILDLSQKVAVLYGHMKSVNVRLFQRVKAGQLVGISDNTGNSTGPHLHLGVCLTNALGFRLNRNNGFAGWVNPMDKKVFNWIITNPNKPIT